MTPFHPYYLSQGYDIQLPDGSPQDDIGSGHGTGIAACALAVAPGVTFTPYQIGVDPALAFARASMDDPDIITCSWGTSYSFALLYSISHAVAKGIVVWHKSPPSRATGSRSLRHRRHGPTWCLHRSAYTGRVAFRPRVGNELYAKLKKPYPVLSDALEGRIREAAQGLNSKKKQQALARVKVVDDYVQTTKRALSEH